MDLKLYICIYSEVIYNMYIYYIYHAGYMYVYIYVCILCRIYYILYNTIYYSTFCGFSSSSSPSILKFKTEFIEGTSTLSFLNINHRKSKSIRD